MNPRLKPWIRWVFTEEATGLLKKEYKAAIQRAGKIWNIVRIMSLRPLSCRLLCVCMGRLSIIQAPA